MKRKHIMLGLPTLGKVSMRWAIAHRGIRSPMNCVVGELIEQGLPVDQARNRIVRRALAMEGTTHVFFIDDDVLVHPHCLLQLLKADKPIVSGVYYSKSEWPEPLIFGEPGTGTMEYVPGTGVHKVWGHGMGLTLIRTEVFREVAEKVDLGTDALGSPKWFYTIGDSPGEPSQETEDLYFLDRARESGIDCHIDMHPYCFGWHYCMERNVGYPEKQWHEYQSGKPVSFEISNEAAAGYREILDGYGQRNAG